METPEITIIHREESLYCQYGGQSEPQDCFIALDIRTGEMWADYNPEIGNAVPMDVWHGLVRRYDIPLVQPDTANAIMESIRSLAEELIVYLAEEWDGSNHVAITDDAEVVDTIEERIHGMLEGYEPDVHTWDAEEWYANDPDTIASWRGRISAGETPGDIANTIEELGTEDDPYLSNLENAIERLTATNTVEWIPVGGGVSPAFDGDED